MLHSTVKFRQNTCIFLKGICKAKFHMLTGENELFFFVFAL